MVVTINTDASFCQKTKAAGWAFWIVYNGIRIKKSAPFKQTPRGSSAAETYAIGNAVAQVLMIDFPKKDPPRLLIMNTDCLAAMQTIKNKSDTPWGKAVADLLKKLRRKYPGLKTEFRHVRAHTDVKDKRSYVNNWCDQEAKYHMKMQRIAIKERQDETKTERTQHSGHSPRGSRGEESNTGSGTAAVQNGGGKAAGSPGAVKRSLCPEAV